MDIEQLHFKFYEVGGKVRDELLGLCSKDVDYVAVPDESIRKCNTTETLFKALELYLRKENFEIFLITPSCFTIRARFPQNYKYSGIADFVLSRKEEYYIEGTRRPVVVPGTLYDDLSRRDFTVNALAKDPDTGEVIDYFGGIEDLKKKVLKTPLDPIITFDDDPLRILRGIRFCVTKGFHFSSTCMNAIIGYDYSKMKVVSEERIREELYKMLKHDTPKTLEMLFGYLPSLKDYIFENTNIWLKPTTEL